tara:strand:+ start:196 stop:987 length:792 start_codon:yes stop_codon:yes gene_type:complete
MKVWFLFILQLHLVSAFVSSVSLKNVKQFSTIHKKNKIITISPAGVGGFYLLGIITYIKEHYDINNYTILGASAGAWTSLAMLYKGDIDELVNDILMNYNHPYLDENNDELNSNLSLYSLQYTLKNILLSNYDVTDFDLKNLNIGSTIINKKGIKPIIICDIKSLNTAITSCFASSHIPFITGSSLFRVDDTLFFDGGFSKFPPKDLNTYFEITPDMWGFKIYDLLNLKKYNDQSLLDLYYKGYKDTANNKCILDEYFTQLIP